MNTPAATGRIVPLILILATLILSGLGLFFWLGSRTPVAPVAPPLVADPRQSEIGRSVEWRALEVYEFGHGSTTLLFVGGIHGGYEWNSVLLAYELIDYLKLNPDLIPDQLTLMIVPAANPDGVAEVIGQAGRFTLADVPAGDNSTGRGRFNANRVDLNRNFDCRWQPKSQWRGQTVSAGATAFSEPEARAIRDLVLRAKPAAVVFWHSQANAVYASECEDGILPGTLDLMNRYARAAGYPAMTTFDSYAVTGDAEDWLASLGIPAITVELKTHQTLDWAKNLAGVKALLEHYGESLVE